MLHYLSILNNVANDAKYQLKYHFELHLNWRFFIMKSVEKIIK